MISKPEPRAMCSCICDDCRKNDCSDGVFFSAMLTPRAILDHAHAGEPFSLTAKGELLFKSGTVPYSRLLRIPLAKPGRLNKYGAIVVDVIVSHRSPISPTADMDPHFMLSDGISAVGLKVKDAANFKSFSPIFAIEGVSGPKLRFPSPTVEDFRVTSGPATVHNLHFRLEPQRPAECFAHASYDREISLYHQYSRVLHPERGLYIEVYRDDEIEEQFLFSFFKIHAQVESSF